MVLVAPVIMPLDPVKYWKVTVAHSPIVHVADGVSLYVTPAMKSGNDAAAMVSTPLPFVVPDAINVAPSARLSNVSVTAVLFGSPLVDSEAMQRFIGMVLAQPEQLTQLILVTL